MLEVILKRFDQPDEVRTFDKGKFELVHIGGMTIGRATYEPGWKWSSHVGATLGKTSCDVEHVGLVIAGRATAAMDDGRVVEMKAGDVFYIAPGHDSWVVGDEPYVSLHFMGAADYAANKCSRGSVIPPSRSHGADRIPHIYFGGRYGESPQSGESLPLWTARRRTSANPGPARSAAAAPAAGCSAGQGL